MVRLQGWQRDGGTFAGTVGHTGNSSLPGPQHPGPYAPQTHSVPNGSAQPPSHRPRALAARRGLWAGAGDSVQQPADPNDPALAEPSGRAVGCYRKKLGALRSEFTPL